MDNVEDVYDLVRNSVKECIIDDTDVMRDDDKLYMDIPMEQLLYIVEKVLIPITVSVVSALLLNRIQGKNKRKREADLNEEELRKIQIEVTEETDEITSPWGICGLSHRVTEKLSINMKVEDDKDLEQLLSIIRQFKNRD